jgi:predicted transport protein
MLSIEPWMKNAQIVRLGKYIIYAPADKNTYTLRIVTDPLNKYIDLEQNKIYIDFNTTNHDSISITDKDKDNSRRTISYDIFDDHDSIIGNVTDVGRDGQLDYKYMRGDGKEMYVKDKDKYIFVAGQWRNSFIRDKDKGVIINGQWKKVKFVNSRYELQ